jgi:hypothetical protein
MSWLDGAPTWIERGDFRLDTTSTVVEQKIRTGSWAPMDWASGFYDPRQDSNTLDSNERRQLVYWFKNAPANVPISDALTWAAANGFQEPDRSLNEGTFGSLIQTVAPYALAVLGVGAAAGAFSAVAAEAAPAAAFAEPTVASVSPSTWAAFGQTASTADMYAAATASAINTSVADYAAAAIMGEATGAASAFSTLPLALSGPVASGSIWSTALDSLSGIAKTGKQAADLVRLVNTTTGQNTIVPKSAPVPAGYKVDLSWSPPLIAMPGATAQEAAAVNPATASEGAGIVAASGSMVPFIALAAALAAVLYLVK